MVVGETLEPAASQIDEAALVAALARREPAAMRALYDRFSHRIYGFLCRLIGDRAVCDDLHQETWLAAARYAGALRPDSDVAAWLFTIARNKHRSWCRWRLMRQSLDAVWADVAAVERETVVYGAATGMHASATASGASTFALAADGNDLHDLERGLRRLPADHREILLLIGCEGLDTKQAARILEISPEAVRQRLVRARALLRQMLAAPDEVGNRRRGKKRARGTR